ncbi:HAD-superfamily hydrolase, subfamily IIB [Coriobacterium glomerans PW2]|uniref:HAD-superfamily hydrolase, subfamily IIB n=1 Tax=Coriobacterium glomerans (strain ATCC 49209 / DSM 20642 / JCM 10262 / PW2) TaxID=700015 RepID=F2N7I2_CORGP|nr:HAD family hydrolase [Coriobacterium glomerans]AEB06798.1 HAD-superfamily hydrolase, subfamily IIB [Coriobacterium glomerans PW2]
MIKLIASDMDGTLLDRDGHVPPETFDLIVALREKGVHFVASSGRRYDRLCEFFAPVKDQMDYVAANGAQVFAEGDLVDREVYSHLGIKRLAKTVSMFANMHLALFDSTKSFLLDDEHKFVREVDKDLPNAERIWELPGAHINIIKASIFCDDGNVMDNAYVLSRELGDEFVFAPSGSSWIDSMQRGITKASGIRQLMEFYGIEREEVMAFGDSMNDYEIIRFVGTGLAMANGRPALRAVADRVIGFNYEQSVQAEMRNVLESI